MNILFIFEKVGVGVLKMMSWNIEKSTKDALFDGIKLNY